MQFFLLKDSKIKVILELYSLGLAYFRFTFCEILSIISFYMKFVQGLYWLKDSLTGNNKIGSPKIRK